MTNRDETTPDAQPTPNNGDQPTDPQPATASVQPAAQMDESTAEKGTQAEASLPVSEGEQGTNEGKAESQLSENVEVGEVGACAVGSPQVRETESIDKSDAPHIPGDTQPVSSSQGESEDDVTGENNGRDDKVPGESEVALSDLMAERLEAAHHRSNANLLEKIEQQRDLGLLWLEAKATTVPQSGLTIEQWVAKHLTFSHQHANACGRLALLYDKCLTAHFWCQQSGIDAGYRTKKNSGYDYMFAVLALHRRWQKGKPPEPLEPRRKAARATPQQFPGTQHDVHAVAQELDRVVRYYRETPQGEGFESPILAVIKAAVSPPRSNSDDASPSNTEDEHHDSSASNSFANWQFARKEREPQIEAPD